MSELTSGGGGGGEDDGEDVWTGNNAGMTGGGVNADCCSLERRGLYLGWGWGLAFGARCGVSTTTSDSSSSSSGSEGSRPWTTRRRFWRGLVVGEYIWRCSPFLSGDTRGVTDPVRDCLCTHVRVRTFRRRRDDDLHACTLT